MDPINLSTSKKVTSWFFQLVAAVIFFQTLFFKFTAAPESVYIFQTIGLEPIGRYFTAVMEAVIVVLLLWYRRAWIGALLGFIVISNAIFFHLTSLGIVVQEDRGTLFIMALVIFCSCIVVLYIHRKRMIHDIENLLYRKKER